MFKSSSWKHLRITFSYYLMPVFWFALALAPNIDAERIVWVWVVLHLFLYPSSNGYNSYFDKDEGSIGGLKHPPRVTGGLYYLSLVFFLLALGTALMVNFAFCTMAGVYGLVSMAYSHPSIRLKKYPYLSWLTAGAFQGYFTFAMTYAGLSDFGWEVFLRPGVYIPGLLTTSLLLGSYPLTQVYQHEEDSRRGDITLSLRLGIKGTFAFSAAWFLFSGLAFVWYFMGKNQDWAFWTFLAAMLPVVFYFFIWFLLVRKNSGKYINYTMTMWMNRISATALNLFFVYYFFKNTQVLQLMNY
ncbi:UbiA family prenyltransferase [Negadavirga shengliensis]|uniref:UbiA family prenyltransferase n=1 Tax=Negadavirga shengliensis TaxID=1389218 RepID=A0ABV9T5N1_9BACT